MPWGILVNCGMVLLGGLLGSLIKKRIPHDLKDSLPVVFGFVAIAMGLMKIVTAHSMLPVTMAVLLGTVLGTILGIDAWLRRMARRLSGTGKADSDGTAQLCPADEQRLELLILAAVSFCASGTGIFGALEEGFSGDRAILLSKAGLDFLTAILFASVAGKSIAWLALPQAAIMLCFFWLGGWLAPWLTPAMQQNFLAVGGIITLMNGCAMARMSPIRAANAVPSLALALLFSLIGQG